MNEIPELNDRLIALMRARDAIEYEYAKPVLQRPLPETHAGMRIEVTYAIEEFLTEAEKQDMREEKKEVYNAIHKRHMGLEHG